jgi:hypothetical protein
MLPAQVRFLRALHTLARSRFDDGLANAVARAVARSESGESVDVAASFETINGALLNRVRSAVEQPTLARLRALWTLVGHNGTAQLRPELERLARAWDRARDGRERESARVALVQWFRRREGAIARSLACGP